MLLVYQSAEMQKMLQKYGGTIVGMDGTYKTNCWGMTLQLIVVVDNHGHGYPAALAILQNEKQEQIAEVLET